jgi:hypothetical protein
VARNQTRATACENTTSISVPECVPVLIWNFARLASTSALVSDRLTPELSEAWSTLNWQLCRPLLSDNLFEVQSYWIGAYRAQGLRNVTERARITNLELVRFTADKWFDAVTVRVHATGLDYTLRVADGAVVGGHRDRERAYTEYWTLIRGAGRTGATRTAAECPNCGAPLQVNMAAVCNYCQAKVNSGAFDWVLSRIEQDEVYVG